MRKRIAALALALGLLCGGCSVRAQKAAQEEAAPASPTPAPTSCPHTHWTDGRCDGCGLLCFHECWVDGVCAVCGMACPHPAHDRQTRQCSLCGAVVRHSFVNSRCACGAAPAYAGGVPQELFEACPQQGTVEMVTYETLNYPAQQLYGVEEVYEKAMAVYLPYGYDPAGQYDVLILLHGMWDSEEYWLVEEQDYTKENPVRTVDLLDNLIYQGYCDKLIVAAPTFYLDERDKETYDPSTDAGLFWPELRHDVLPYLAEHYATYAAGASEEAISRARDHFGYVGLSMGSIIGYQSVMSHCLDMVAWLGCLSGYGSSSYGVCAALEEQDYTAYPIRFLYNGCGAWDSALLEHRAGYAELDAITDAITDGENSVFITLPQTTHEYKGWITGLYNCLQVFFALPAEESGGA